jgi:pyridinium-3,5-biscarboxylic acid mononucleotide sulfurtransferase
MQNGLAAKKDALERLLANLGSVVVAYSGGVDSSYLADVAHETLGEGAVVVTAVSPSLARRELKAADDLARRRGWRHELIGTHEVAREDYARNDPDRCYWCKTELFEVLAPIAETRNASIVLGTNVDDLGDHRPGLRAADEQGVRAPFVEVGLSKSEIRILSATAGLPTADKPASPCLSSRIAYGVRVTPQRLRRIDAAEDFLLSLGLRELRVRDHGELARIEVPGEALQIALDNRERITARLTELGWRYVTLDLEGFRSGSMNEVLQIGFGSR